MELKRYLFTLPERLVRSVVGLGAGVAREVGDLALPQSVRQSRLYQNLVDTTLRCCELCGTIGYAENDLLEKWARDAKILDIFEGTQQIQLLIVARRLLGKSSSELR